jgi:hypothetical protein
MSLLLYILTIIISYFIFRCLYKIQGEEAKNNPHFLTIVFMLIPFGNVGLPLMLLIPELIIKVELKRTFNYKKFFRLK